MLSPNLLKIEIETAKEVFRREETAQITTKLINSIALEQSYDSLKLSLKNDRNSEVWSQAKEDIWFKEERKKKTIDNKNKLI